MVVFVDNLTAAQLLLPVLKKLGVWRKVLGKPYVTAYDRVMPDGHAAQNGSVGVDDHIILNDRMSRYVYRVAVLIELKALGTKRNSLLELYMITYYCSLSYNHSGTVVYAEILTDAGSWMNVYTG